MLLISKGIISLFTCICKEVYLYTYMTIRFYMIMVYRTDVALFFIWPSWNYFLKESVHLAYYCLFNMSNHWIMAPLLCFSQAFRYIIVFSLKRKEKFVLSCSKDKMWLPETKDKSFFPHCMCGIKTEYLCSRIVWWHCDQDLHCDSERSVHKD